MRNYFLYLVWTNFAYGRRYNILEHGREPTKKNLLEDKSAIL